MSIKDDIKHIPSGMFPVDFELEKGGNLNLEVKGNKLWLCYNGECLIRARGFEEVTVEGESLETIKELHDQLQSISDDEYPGPREPPREPTQADRDRWKEERELIKRLLAQTGPGTGAINKKADKQTNKE